MEWISVRNGKNLPKVGDEVLAVEDVRGTQDEWTRNFFNKKFSDGEFYTVPVDGKQIAIFGQDIVPIVRTVHGWVHEVGYSEETRDWYISLRGSPRWNHLRGTVSNADALTHWMPMPAPIVVERCEESFA